MAGVPGQRSWSGRPAGQATRARPRPREVLLRPRRLLGAPGGVLVATLHRLGMRLPEWWPVSHPALPSSGLARLPWTLGFRRPGRARATASNYPEQWTALNPKGKKRAPSARRHTWAAKPEWQRADRTSAPGPAAFPCRRRGLGA